jgi:hypothetical protein
MTANAIVTWPDIANWALRLAALSGHHEANKKDPNNANAQAPSK